MTAVLSRRSNAGPSPLAAIPSDHNDNDYQASYSPSWDSTDTITGYYPPHSCPQRYITSGSFIIKQAGFPSVIIHREFVFQAEI